MLNEESLFFVHGCKFLKFIIKSRTGVFWFTFSASCLVIFSFQYFSQKEADEFQAQNNKENAESTDKTNCTLQQIVFLEYVIGCVNRQ